MEYTCQYQSMSAKEERKVVFSNRKKFNLDGPDGFQKYWHAKNFPGENYSTRPSGEGSLMIWRNLLIFRKTETTICQWSTKSSKLCGDSK